MNSPTEAAACPRCGEPASVELTIDGSRKRLLLCDHCRFWEMTDVPPSTDAEDAKERA